MTGSVDNVEAESFPECGGSGRNNGNTPLALLLHPVHLGRTLVDVTDFVAAAGVIKDAFRGRGFTGINVRDNTDIAHLFKRYIPLLCRNCCRLSCHNNKNSHALAQPPCFYSSIVLKNHLSRNIVNK